MGSSSGNTVTRFRALISINSSEKTLTMLPFFPAHKWEAMASDSPAAFAFLMLCEEKIHDVGTAVEIMLRLTGSYHLEPMLLMDVNVKSNTFFVHCHRGATASFGGLNGNDEHYLAYAYLNLLHSAVLKTSGHCRIFYSKRWPLSSVLWTSKHKPQNPASLCTHFQVIINSFILIKASGQKHVNKVLNKSLTYCTFVHRKWKSAWIKYALIPGLYKSTK